jgi:cell division protein FtsQ
VRIKERQPVAVVQVPGPDGTTLYNLVDADAVMLDPRRASRLALPVLNGVSPADKESVRKDRVKRFLRLQTELGSVMEHISEVDVTEPDNLRVVYAIEGRALTLMLGNQKFLERFQNFTDNYSEIKKRLGNATVLDLRLKDRITAVASEESE